MRQSKIPQLKQPRAFRTKHVNVTLYGGKNEI